MLAFDLTGFRYIEQIDNTFKTTMIKLAVQIKNKNFDLVIWHHMISPP